MGLALCLAFAGSAAAQEPPRDTARTADAIRVIATRTERRIEDVPLRVEVLEREEIEEKMLMTPGDISMMLNETGGLRVQTTAPSMGAANVRIQGLRGRYTLLLSDGLPLHGGQAGSLGMLQIPPMDLAQVEIIKGVASALYGASALGGVINLGSRRPRATPERELLLNQTTRNGTDAVIWSSERMSRAWGYTVLGGAHRQAGSDVDSDGWIDMPAYRRGVVRPRVFWSGDNGRNAMLTVGTTIEDRDGGTAAGRVTPGGTSFTESLATRAFDAGAVARFPFSTSVFSARGSGTIQRHRHRFGGTLERDRHHTWFGELSLASSHDALTTVVGGALQIETFASQDVARFDYAYTTPAAFAQIDFDPAAWLALSASGRIDAHSAFGALFNPRLSVLFRPGGEWSVRMSAGTGASTPGPLTEQTEATGLTPLRPHPALAAERASSAALDVGGVVGPFEVNATMFLSRIRSPLIVREAPGAPGELEMVNALLPTRTSGTDLLLRHRIAELVTTISYTFVRSTEQAPLALERRPAPLTPAHTAGLVSVWERDGAHRVGLEAYFTGRQSLEDNPYLATSKPYVVFGAIAERRVGTARVFINLENLGGIRMTTHQPLVRPAPGPGGRWTTDAWGPLEGRTINAGARFTFGGSE